VCDTDAVKWSFGIGRIAGIRIELHVTFVLFVVWLAASQGIAAGDAGRAVATAALLLLIFGCVLLHELGHALTARRYGIRTRSIILLPIGGVANLERMPENPRHEIVVAIAGPAVNVAIVAILLFSIPAAFIIIYMELKVIAFMNLRVGPDRVRPLPRGDPAPARAHA